MITLIFTVVIVLTAFTLLGLLFMKGASSGPDTDVLTKRVDSDGQ